MSSRLDAAISDLNYITDCLIALRNIHDVGRDCNTCKNKDCEWRPGLGEQIRFNCPHWKGGNK